MDSLACTVLIPCAGGSARFAVKAGVPKPLLKFQYSARFGTMLDHVIPEFSTIEMKVLVAYRATQSGFFAHAIAKEHRQIQIHRTVGQADTVKQAAEAADDGDLLVINSDNAFHNGVLEHFVNRCRGENVTAGAVVFVASSERYGYVDDCPFFIRGAEKSPISNYALAGAFYYKNSRILSAAYNRVARNVTSHPGELYLSQLFEHMPPPKLAHLIQYSEMHEWGTPELLERDPQVEIDWNAQNED